MEASSARVSESDDDVSILRPPSSTLPTSMPMSLCCVPSMVFSPVLRPLLFIFTVCCTFSAGSTRCTKHGRCILQYLV